MSKPKIMIVGAMDRELRDLLSFYECSKMEKLQNTYPMWCSSVERPFDLAVLQTYVGDINAIISTTLALDLYNPDYVFKIGCVGGSSLGLRTGDLVMPLGFFSTTSWITRSKVDNQPTSDASKWQSVFGNKPYQVNSNNLGGHPYFFEPDISITSKYASFFADKHKKPRSAFIGGGNMWFFDLGFAKNASYAQIPGRRSERVWAADMESYAIAQACHVFKKPFMGFYRVSDNYFENEQYVPEKVDMLFDRDFIKTIDEFLKMI